MKEHRKEVSDAVDSYIAGCEHGAMDISSHATNHGWTLEHFECFPDRWHVMQTRGWSEREVQEAKNRCLDAMAKFRRRSESRRWKIIGVIFAALSVLLTLWQCFRSNN